MLTLVVAAFGVYSAAVCFLAGERFASFAVGGLVVVQLGRHFTRSL